MGNSRNVLLFGPGWKRLVVPRHRYRSVDSYTHVEEAFERIYATLLVDDSLCRVERLSTALSTGI